MIRTIGARHGRHFARAIGNAIKQGVTFWRDFPNIVLDQLAFVIAQTNPPVAFTTTSDGHPNQEREAGVVAELVCDVDAQASVPARFELAAAGRLRRKVTVGSGPDEVVVQQHLHVVVPDRLLQRCRYDGVGVVHIDEHELLKNRTVTRPVVVPNTPNKKIDTPWAAGRRSALARSDTDQPYFIVMPQLTRLVGNDDARAILIFRNVNRRSRCGDFNTFTTGKERIEDGVLTIQYVFTLSKPDLVDNVWM